MDSKPVAKDVAFVIRTSGFTEDELRFLEATVRARLRTLRMEIAMRLRPGMRVGFGRRGARGKQAWKEGRFLVLARTRARIDCDGVVWNVPLSMVEILEDSQRE